MALSLQKREKKALVRLHLKKDESQLGFATKVYRPAKKDVLLVTSPSILPDNTDAPLNEIVVHRCVARSWWSRKFCQMNPFTVKNIDSPKQADVSTVVFEGGDKKNCLQCKVLTEKDLKKEHKILSACVYEDKELIQLNFKKQKGSRYKLMDVSKEGYDVKRAKGAPVLIEEERSRVLGLPIYVCRIVGVLSMNSNGDLYPVLFKDGFLEESPSSSDTEEAGPSGIDEKKSGEDVQTKTTVDPSDNRESDTEEPGPSGIGKTSGDFVQTEKTVDPSDNRLTEMDYDEDSKKLKEAIKENTEYQTKFMSAHDIPSEKTDEIFTNLTVYYADKKQVRKEQEKNLSRRVQLQEYTKRTAGFKVKKLEDIFIKMKGKNRKLLLTGKPGIGKTFFCEKNMRDWSMNRSFQNEGAPDIKFAYLLKFRDLDGKKKLNLKELLNCSPLLDENSKIDDSLFEYLTKNSSNLMIILDGLDEYSHQHRKAIASDFEKKYPNDSTKKMPISALFSKLIKGKLLTNSVVLVSSRPGEAEELGKIKFDRFVEISGFSPEQVTEFVDSYFSEPEKEQTKNTVREHVEKNENLVSFCHIPLLCFLLCWCLEWRVTQSGSTQNLPAKITDLYDEVVKVVVQKLHANTKYLEMSENTMKIAKETLDKLKKLAAILLKESKYIFDEEDMKKLNLSEDEIKNLKVSGILHCVPGIRNGPFETKTEYSFIHLTLQEYLSASFFVKNKELPKKEEASGQTRVFMSGLSRGKDGELMKQLIQQITPKNWYDGVNKLLMLQCLYEYGEDELTKRTINNLYDVYCDGDGEISFRGVTDVDAKYLSYLLDIIHLLKEQHPLLQSSSGYTLYISGSPLTSFGFGVVCDSLVRNSFITGLMLSECSLDDKCIGKITDSLVNTGITYLDLGHNNITDEGAENICRVIIQDDCHVTELVLSYNKKITEKCKKRVKQLVQEHKPGVNLFIR